MPFDASTAEPVAVQSGFDASTAEPVSASIENEQPKPDPIRLNEKEFMEASPIGRLKMMLSHPWDKYVASVDQAFTGPKIPRVTGDQGTDVISRAGQVGAAATNVVTGAASSAVSPGAVSAILQPQTLIYSAPRFIAGGVSDIIDAVKGAVSGKAGLQETTEKGLGGTLMLAGGAHIARTGLSSSIAPRTPEEAIVAIKAEANKISDQTAKAALDAAAEKIATTADQGVKFDPSTAEPVTQGEPHADTIESSAQEVRSNAESTPSGGQVAEGVTGKPEGASGARSEESQAQPTNEALNDYTRYQDIQEQWKNLLDKGISPDSPEVMSLWKENEEIKNRHEGMPPPPVEAQTNLDLEAPENKASETTPTEPPEPPTYGIAARVSDVRSDQGNIAPIEPGEGVSTEQSIIHGRDLIESGRDPQSAIDDFNRTGKISYEDISLARARGEQLAKAAYDAEAKFGFESPQYKAAAQADSEWTKAIKPMQTEWAKIGQAQQGETEVDTGTFHGLRRAFTEATGKDFTPEQADQAKKISSDVKAATDEAAEAQQKLLDQISQKISPEARTLSKRVADALDEAAQSALDRIKARRAEGRVYSGIDPEEFGDYVIYGAAKLAKGAIDFGKWSSDMASELGDYIKPHLQEIWDRAREEVDRRKQELAIQNDEAKKPGSVQDIWQRAKDYIDGGETDYDEIRHKIATDLGMPVEEVTKKLTEPKGAKAMTNEMYAKLAARQKMIQNAKNWLQNQQTPGWLRFMRSVPRIFFIDKILGHGTVGMITHAGLNAFDASAWSTYWPNFFRQFKLLGWHDKGAYHEMMMQGLVRDPNYITARRAGLANDPMKYTDDFQNTWVGSYLDKVGLTGNRGFDALKLFRQARFNQIWNAFPESMKTADNAKMVADSVNHATGVVRMKFREWANWTFFAPKLEGSRWAWMIGDPAKAAKIISKWSEASDAEKAFALREVKQKATIAGVYLGLLALNQGLLSATGSNQKINVTDPRRSDFLAFKAGGYKFGIISPLIGVVRLLANLVHAAGGTRGKVESMTPRAEEFGQIGESYLRGKLSPFAGFATDLASQSDFQGRPLPFSSDKVPSNLRKKGIGKYTYAEYAAQQFTPIPVSEAIHEVWAKQGMDENTMVHYLKAITSGLVAGSTGARMSKDTHAGEKAKH